MSGQAYIVSTDLLESFKPGCEWHATIIRSDPTQSLIVVLWDNPNLEAEWEARPEVKPLGQPWEPLPVEATNLLASLEPAENDGGGIPKSLDLLSAPDTVSTALRKVDWPGWKLLR